MAEAPDLRGHRVLVVEDEYCIASDTARALRSAGAEVMGPCPSEADARNDGIPFVFVTGYDSEEIPEQFRNIRRLQKPVPLRSVVEEISKLVC